VRRWLSHIAALLPREGRTGRVALILAGTWAVLLAVAHGWAAQMGEAETPVSWLLVGALGLLLYALFVLAILAGFRRVVRQRDRLSDGKGPIPLIWRITLLWPYRRQDIDRMAAEGRLAELMTFAFVLISVIGLTLAVTLPHTPAQAAESAVTDLLLKPRSTPRQIEQSTQRQVEDNADPALAFSLLLPKDWLKYEPYAPEKPDAPGLVLLSRYGSRDQRAMLEVYGQKIVREMSSADWLEAWLRQNGYAVLKWHTAYSAAGWNADVLAQRSMNGRDFVYRMSSFKNADRLYLVFGYAEPAAYAVAEEPFVIAANSFQLVHGADVPSAEPLRTVQMSRVLPARFVFPTSWEESRDDSVGSDRDSLNFKNQADDQPIGRLNVLVAPPSAYASHGELADTLLEAVKGATGADVTSMALAPVDLRTDLQDAREGEAEVEVKGSTIKVRLTIARAGNAWVSFLLIGYKPKPDLLLIDAINRRAYDIAVRTFGPSA